MAPMRNEARHIEQLVADLAAQDLEQEVEVLVADGRSTDDCVERLQRAAERTGLNVTVLDNPAGWVSHGLNACIERASGDLIVRVDCHSRYPHDYLRRLVAVAEATGADNVGGILVAEGRTGTERAVACAMATGFGGVHWTRHEDDHSLVEVDTVAYGAYRPVAFERAGVFDETLVRDQDEELNLRLRRAGGTIVLDPSIRLRYTPRGTFRGLFRQYYEYGLWKVPVMLKHRAVVSARSMVPLAFVSSLVVLLPAAFISTWALRLLVAEIAAYLVAGVVFGGATLRARREPVTLLPRIVFSFGAFHVGHGVGMAHGWLRAALGRGG